MSTVVERGERGDGKAAASLNLSMNPTTSSVFRSPRHQRQPPITLCVGEKTGHLTVQLFWMRALMALLKTSRSEATRETNAGRDRSIRRPLTSTQTRPSLAAALELLHDEGIADTPSRAKLSFHAFSTTRTVRALAAPSSLSTSTLLSPRPGLTCTHPMTVTLQARIGATYVRQYPPLRASGEGKVRREGHGHSETELTR